MKEIFKTSEMVSKKFRIEVPHYKAIIGKNATKHEAGIHVQYCEGYEIFKPEDLGMKREIVLGKHSGIHTVFEIAKINRIEINSEEAMRILKAVKENDLKITEREFKEFKSKII